MKAVITVIGQDSVGIIAKVSEACSKYDINILDITQSVLKEYFAMVMLVDISKSNIVFTDFVDNMKDLGKTMGLQIITMHEEIFQSMHKI